MRGFGFNVTIDGTSYQWTDGGDSSLQDKFNWASYECSATHPIRGDLTAPLTMSERAYFQTLLKTQFEPCIQEFGLTEFQAPSRLWMVVRGGAQYNPAHEIAQLYPDEDPLSIGMKVESCQSEMNPVRVYPGQQGR